MRSTFGGNAPSDVGSVTPNFAQGALLLKDAEGRYFRLSWEKPPTPEESDRPGRHLEFLPCDAGDNAAVNVDA